MGLPFTIPGFPITGSAGFDEVDDMKAAFATLKGWSAVNGLAVHTCQSNQWPFG